MLLSTFSSFFFKPFPERQIFNSSKLKEFVDNSFRFDEIGKLLSERVESTAGKGEIAHYEQCLLFPEYFQETCDVDVYKPRLVW